MAALSDLFLHPFPPHEDEIGPDRVTLGRSDLAEHTARRMWGGCVWTSHYFLACLRDLVSRITNTLHRRPSPGCAQRQSILNGRMTSDGAQLLTRKGRSDARFQREMR